MPAGVAEVGAGAQFSRSAQDNQTADTATRTFRIVLSSPQEALDIQNACGVFIGNIYPTNPDLTCTSFDARYEGESRMVVQATFNYTSQNSQQQQDQKQQSPEVRPANWTTSSTLMEVPRSTWRQRISDYAWSDEVAALSPAGDMYDGLTASVPVVAIAIEQWEATDPTRHLEHVGSVNAEEIALGSLRMKPGTVMFRGLNSQPAVEAWGDLKYRGWKCTYDFAYRKNTTKVTLSGVAKPFDIGWDIAVPMSGFNCRAFNPATAADDEDEFGQPLKHSQGKIVATLALPTTVDPGDRVRAMVKVFEYEDGGASQAPSASPIALKPNGRPLLTHNSSGTLVNPPFVFAYRLQPEINFTTTLGLRLF